MSYAIVFGIVGLPKTANSLLGAHWRVRSGHAKKWRKAVATAVMLNGGAPAAPLERATLTLTRCSSVEPDFDGLTSSMKCVIDGLVACGVLANDKSANIGQPKYAWEKCSPKLGSIRVKVEAL